MPRKRRLCEVDTLVARAREYCAAQADFRSAKSEGRLNAEDELHALAILARMDEKIALLKSNNELGRRRLLLITNVIPLAPSRRGAVR